MSQGSYVTAAATTAGVLAGAYCVYHIYNETKTSKLPTTWKKVGILDHIFMYPLKSCGGIQKTTAECTSLGLKDGWLRDRMLMVVNDDYKAVTGRIFPKLLLVKPTITHSTVTLKCKDMEPLHLDLEQIIATQSPKEATLWGIRYPVYECGLESNAWFSRFLNKSQTGYRLVLFRDSGYKILSFKKNPKEAFADEVPFNLLNQASIDDLNTRLNGVQVNHKHFRTNFVLSGAQPYDEDNWKFIKIGENIFEITRPCPRCIMTTNNPETGVRDSNVEPLATLRSYRQETDPEVRRITGTAPRMGLQMVLRSGNGGIVSIKEPIYINDCRPRNIRTKKAIKAVKERIRTNPIRKQKILSLGMNIAPRTVSHILKDELGVVTYKRCTDII